MVGFVALAVFAVLFLRLWALQVLAGDKYLARANDNRVRTRPGRRSARADRRPERAACSCRTSPGRGSSSGRPTCRRRWPAERAELRALAEIAGIPSREILQKLKRTARPAHAGRRPAGLHQDQISTSRSTRPVPRGPARRGATCAVPVPVAARAGARLRRPDLARRVRQLKGAGYSQTMRSGRPGVESTYDKYLRGRDGSAQLTVDSQGRPKGQLAARVQPQPGDNAAADDRLRPAAGRREGAPLRIQTARNASEPTPTAARSSRSTRATAPCSRWRRTRPTSRPSTSGRRHDQAGAAPRPEGRGKATTRVSNRAIDAGYPPGSTFKPVTALAAMQEHLVTPYELHPCTPDFHGVQADFDNWTP